MKEEVSYAELHDGFNLKGTNLTGRLDIQRTQGLSMYWDYEIDKLVISLKGATVKVPPPNVKCYADMENNPNKKVHQVASPMVANIAHTAQVETPFGHVHAGPGKGKTGVAKK